MCGNQNELFSQSITDVDKKDMLDLINLRMQIHDIWDFRFSFLCFNDLICCVPVSGSVKHILV